MPYINDRTFISHSFGGQEVQDPCSGRFIVWQEPPSWFPDGHVTVSSHSRRDKGALQNLFCGGANPIHEGFTLVAKLPPEVLIPKCHHIGD